MIKKKIANIVFYKIDNETEKQACIFYEDGTVEKVSFDEGIDACEVLVKEYNITSKNVFQSMINNKLVHVMSAKDFSEKFSSFIPTPAVIETQKDEENDKLLSAAMNNVVQAADQEVIEKAKPEEVVEQTVAPTISDEDAEKNEEREADIFAEASASVDKEVAKMVAAEEKKSSDEIDDPTELFEEENASEEIVAPTEMTEEERQKMTEAYNKARQSLSENDDEADMENYEVGTGDEDPFTENDGENIPKVDAEIEDIPEEKEAAEQASEKDQPSEKKKGIFKRAWHKIKKTGLVKRIGVCVTALALATGLFACSSRKSLEGQMINNNLTSTTTTTDANLYNTANLTMVTGNNAYYNNYTFDQLQAVTTNTTQKTAMFNLHSTLSEFNVDFASHYLENGKNVRAALKFDEMIALQMAYNDYTKKDILAIFNGAEIRSDQLVRSYKDASLQLMGAYAMENSRNPLDMSSLIASEEGKAFYNKYHEAFLAAKEATGDDKIEKVKAFYAMVRADFPITQEVRTEGISHAENYEKITPYKLSVTPMIAAAEMMWQNLKVDNTLKDGEIDFLNDLGLCNYAEETFERIETITLTSVEDTTNPTYEQYRAAIIAKMIESGYYYIDDEHRELTKLDSFQEAVNGNFDLNKGTGKTGGSGKTTTTTSTRQEVKTHTETTTTYTEEVERINKPIPADVQAQIDAQIAAENEAARRQAEIEAERERQRLQAIADEEARRIEEQIRKEEEDLQNKINNANAIINNNNSDQNANNDKKINQSDFGDHNVVFDPNHQDGNGNLNDSVQNITTDPTGDKTNEPLPDPNETGKKFDSAAPQYTQTGGQVVLPTTGQNGGQEQFWVEEGDSHEEDSWTEVSDVYIDPEYQGYYQQTATRSNEELVSDYVNGLENQQGEDGTNYQYTR